MQHALARNLGRNRADDGGRRLCGFLRSLEGLLDEESRVGHLATFLRAHGTIERVGPADVARSVGA